MAAKVHFFPDITKYSPDDFSKVWRITPFTCLVSRATCTSTPRWPSRGLSSWPRHACRRWRSIWQRMVTPSHAHLFHLLDGHAPQLPVGQLLPSGIFMAAVKRLLSAPWKLLAIVRNFRRLARNFRRLARNLRRLARNLRRLARNLRRLARNLHAVAGAVLLRLFHHVVAQLLEWFSDSCSYIIVVICPFLPHLSHPPHPGWVWEV